MRAAAPVHVKLSVSWASLARLASIANSVTVSLSLHALRRAALIATLVVFVPLSALDAGLHTSAAPNGIVSFELAGDGAPAILQSWGEAQRRDALLLQGLDYLFLLVYAALLACAALERGKSSNNARIVALAPLVAWLAVLAGIADAIENVPLILMLRSGPSSLGATVALVFASLKFALISIVVAYLAVGWWLAREHAARQPT